MEIINLLSERLEHLHIQVFHEIIINSQRYFTNNCSIFISLIFRRYCHQLASVHLFSAHFYRVGSTCLGNWRNSAGNRFVKVQLGVGEGAWRDRRGDRGDDKV